MKTRSAHKRYQSSVKAGFCPASGIRTGATLVDRLGAMAEAYRQRVAFQSAVKHISETNVARNLRANERKAA